jgi:hypothetical protein
MNASSLPTTDASAGLLTSFAQCLTAEDANALASTLDSLVRHVVSTAAVPSLQQIACEATRVEEATVTLASTEGAPAVVVHPSAVMACAIPCVLRVRTVGDLQRATLSASHAPLSVEPVPIHVDVSAVCGGCFAGSVFVARTLAATKGETSWRVLPMPVKRSTAAKPHPAHRRRATVQPFTFQAVVSSALKPFVVAELSRVHRLVWTVEPQCGGASTPTAAASAAAATDAPTGCHLELETDDTVQLMDDRDVVISTGYEEHIVGTLLSHASSLDVPHRGSQTVLSRRVVRNVQHCTEPPGASWRWQWRSRCPARCCESCSPVPTVRIWRWLQRCLPHGCGGRRFGIVQNRGTSWLKAKAHHVSCTRSHS